tara:strand:+ start:735 stop:1490 length:756 start_codon:yes stop_codon:yes gene_type:complete
MSDFSYQLYSSRDAANLSDTLTMLARLGYSGVEGYGALFADRSAVDSLVADLKDSALKMPTAHMDIDMVENQPDRVLKIAKAVGIKTVFVPFLLPDDRPTTAVGWRQFGERLDAAGAPLRKASLGFGWHNHDFEFQPVSTGEIPLDLILEVAPSLIWEADIAWIVRGGSDPLDWIEKHGDRIAAVHVKDIAAEGQNTDEDGWADVGEGIMDWPGIMKALRGKSVAHFIMEHDNPSDDKRFAERSLKAARKF